MSFAQLQEQLTWANFQLAVQQSDVKLAEWSLKAGLEKPLTSMLLAQAFGIFLVSTILVKVVMSFLSHRKLELQLANIPTVPHSFPFQHLLQLLQRPPWDVLCDWVSKFGTMLRFHFVNTYIVVADVDVVKHIMYTNVHNYQKDLKTTYKPFLAVLGTGVVTAHGDLWRQERSIVANAFRLEILGFASRVSYAAAERLMKRLEPLRGTSEPVIMAEELRRLTLQVIGEAVLSLPPEESDKVFPELYFPIVKEANKLTWYPWRRFLPLPGTFAYHNCTKRLNAYMTNLVRTRWAKRQVSKPKPTIGSGGNKADFEMEGDILDRVLESITPDRWNDETVRQLRDECKTFILAGHETSSMMLCWAVYELMKNPRCLAKVREEAAQVFTKGGVPNFEDFKKLNYTYNVLKETLRKYALVPVVTREVVEDDQVGDYFFPKGSFIAILIKSIHHQKALWNDPEVFRPERFEEKLGHQFQFLPFIEGPRNCLGQHFALLESKIILSMLVSRFTFEPAPGNEGVPHPYEIPVGPEDNMRLLVK